jgi:serine/threonine-protein kinase
MHQNQPNPANDCPDLSVLKAFDLGTVPEDLLGLVAGHLAVCRNCETLLESIRGGEDAFIRDLRQIVRAAPRLLAEAGLQTRADLPAHNGGSSGNARTALDGIPRRFGEYELLEKLPAGGMSDVFKARQFRPNRLVAIKIPHCAPVPGLEAFERFQREIEAIAQLQHEHVVRIYECGAEEGLRYFSMEYLEGGSLAAKLTGAPLPEREAAQLVQTLARAVHFVHQHDIIHRDLKPANVLLGADGCAKLTDFGLAKWLNGEDELTRSHAILGTAKYMAPEQARGDTQQVGPLTDVYGLGTILYECLTGRAPFRGATPDATLRLVESSPPTPPSMLRRGLCRTLEAICLKCLEKDPKQRYASAEELADDLKHWLNHEPTKARPPRWPARVYRKARRHVLALSLIAAVLVGLATVIVFDPERPVRKIEGKLANHEPVTLIGETGKPSWSRLLAGKANTEISLDASGIYTVYSWGDMCLLELVRNPQQDRYHFLAQVCQRSGEKTGEVGLFLAQRTFRGSSADLHVFTQLSLSDVFDAVDQFNNLPLQHRLGRRPPKGNYVELCCRIHSADPEKKLPRELFRPVIGAPFKPTGASVWKGSPEERRPWYDLEVVVTPENLRAFRDGQLVCDLTIASISKRANDGLARWVRDHPDDPSLRGISADFQPRGSLGLYVSYGSAQFRSVRIVPGADEP